MLQVDERFEVAAPRKRVFGMWTAVERFPQFMTGVDAVHAETEERMRWQLSIAGVEPVVYTLITERVPDQRLAWASVDLTTMGWWIDLEELAPERTLVTVRMMLAPRGDERSLPGAHELDERTIRIDMQRFRSLAEGRLERAA